jgi:hypothetical protein
MMLPMAKLKFLLHRSASLATFFFVLSTESLLFQLIIQIDKTVNFQLQSISKKSHKCNIHSCTLTRNAQYLELMMLLHQSEMPHTALKPYKN